MRGRSLTVQERTIMQPYFAHIVLERARIVDGSVGGRVPFWLHRDMCAVVLGNTIYFRAGYYQPITPESASLLGHELTHVSQFLHGMTLFKYVWSCRKGCLQSSYEIEAYAKGQLIAQSFNESTL